jgi:hypothetical protein
MPSVSVNFVISGDTITAVAVSTLTRSDTGAAPSGVSLPIVLTLTSGAWVGSFTDPGTLPPYYNATLSITYSDSSVQSVGGVTIGSGSTVAGVYGDISDIRAEMGSFNEQQSADPDNAGDPTQISLHEQKAIAFADSYINSELKTLGFATPATVNLDLLRVIFGKLGAYQLYQVRGLQDKNNAFQAKFDWADAKLQELTYLNNGGFTRATGYSDAPIGVPATVDAQGMPITTFVSAPWWGGWQWWM